MAYIIPAYKVFDDIENRFGGPPRLPSETAPDPVQNRIIRSSEPTQNLTAARRLSAAALNFDDGVCEVRPLWLGSKLPQECSSWQKHNRSQSRIEVISPKFKLEPWPSSYRERLPMKASDDSSNRIVNVAATLGQRTRCQPSDTSGSQLLELHTREDHSKKSQILQDSYSRAPLVTERRRTRILARALATDIANMASVHLEEVRPQNPFMRRNHPARRLPLRLSRLPSSEFEFNFPDPLLPPRARRELPRLTACLGLPDVEGTRFRASINKAARLTDFSGDPPQHLNEVAKALTSQFDDLLRSRRLSECRAACGDSLGKFQQHGATLGNESYRFLPIAMGIPNLHVLSDHLPATFSRLEEFLQDRRDATISFESLQFPSGYLEATLWHDENSPVGDHNAAAHFEGTLRRLTDGTDGKSAAESLLFLMTGPHGFLVDNEYQTPGLLIWLKVFFHGLTFYVTPCQVLSRSPERLRFFFWWENDSAPR